jgi:circadian clock protein KaiB
MIKRRANAKAETSAGAFEKAAAKKKPQAHFFRLYVAGSSQRSLRAVKKIKEICEKELSGHYTLEIIDLYQQPARAIADQIVAAPTLVRRLPEPIRLVGDLSDDQKVLSLFNLQKTKEK